MRSSKISRKTGETDIELFLNLDDCSRGKISSGSGFLDHMLNLFQVHGGFHLDLTCKGDTEVDMHHSMEDIAIVLGQVLMKVAKMLSKIDTASVAAGTRSPLKKAS